MFTLYDRKPHSNRSKKLAMVNGAEHTGNDCPAPSTIAQILLMMEGCREISELAGTHSISVASVFRLH